MNTIYIVALDGAAVSLMAGIDPVWDEKALAAICSRPAFIGWCARDEAGKLMGYIIGDAMDEEAEIIHIAVAPRHRRRGIGRRLLAGFMAGRKRCFLEVGEDNRAAIGLYEAAGFEGMGRRRGYYGGVDGLRMLYTSRRISLSG